ncbi:hypothetical protein [Paenibacillus solani]|uniref:Uncharacterized protein n=1 Tax=Paenibacillus solani TaxID=1705565 RepID=A0A0M1P5I4_9BACL|nr:hypothetical protein [Paenibacillus solani]KOR89743.1 hypothetical protein AM231_11770 [Paenibacillus solani]
MKNIQLVLDVAGVLITNFSPGFWHETASASGITYRELKRLFAAEIRKPLWTGEHGHLSWPTLTANGSDLSMRSWKHGVRRLADFQFIQVEHGMDFSRVN